MVLTCSIQWCTLEIILCFLRQYNLWVQPTNKEIKASVLYEFWPLNDTVISSNVQHKVRASTHWYYPPYVRGQLQFCQFCQPIGQRCVRM